MPFFQITNHLLQWGDQTSGKMAKPPAAADIPMRTRSVRAGLMMRPEPRCERQLLPPSNAHPPRSGSTAASSDTPTSLSATAVLHERGAPFAWRCWCSACPCSPIALLIAAHVGSLYSTYPCPALPAAGGGVGWSAPH